MYQVLSVNRLHMRQSSGWEASGREPVTKYERDEAAHGSALAKGDCFHQGWSNQGARQCCQSCVGSWNHSRELAPAKEATWRWEKEEEWSRLLPRFYLPSPIRSPIIGSSWEASWRGDLGHLLWGQRLWARAGRELTATSQGPTNRLLSELGSSETIFILHQQTDAILACCVTLPCNLGFSNVCNIAPLPSSYQVFPLKKKKNNWIPSCFFFHASQSVHYIFFILQIQELQSYPGIWGRLWITDSRCIFHLWACVYTNCPLVFFSILLEFSSLMSSLSNIFLPISFIISFIVAITTVLLYIVFFICFLRQVIYFLY